MLARDSQEFSELETKDLKGQRIIINALNNERQDLSQELI